MTAPSRKSDAIALIAELEDSLRRSGADEDTVARIVTPIGDWAHSLPNDAAEAPRWGWEHAADCWWWDDDGQPSGMDLHGNLVYVDPECTCGLDAFRSSLACLPPDSDHLVIRRSDLAVMGLEPFYGREDASRDILGVVAYRLVAPGSPTVPESAES